MDEFGSTLASRYSVKRLIAPKPVTSTVNITNHVETADLDRAVNDLRRNLQERGPVAPKTACDVGVWRAFQGLHCAEALIDGEAVALRADGRSDFHALLTTEGGLAALLVAFDLLRLNGDDLRERPIEARREALARLVAGAEGIVFSEALAADGAVVFKKACELGLEGIVSKRAGSRYRGGRSRTWLKTKQPNTSRRRPD